MANIDDYAQSMFRFEYLNDDWINSCATYLRAVFGGSLRDQTVVDYAFGRGNWSVAFLVAGAKRVVAIDAAESNVRKLSDYVRERNLDGVAVVHGNIVEKPLNYKADILWIYGILPCIEEPQPFLRAIARLAGSPHAQSLLYSYDAGSLRQIVVDLARKGQRYRTYGEFAGDSLLFHPAARHRARDDLTAPVVKFYSQNELAALAMAAGYSPLAFARSFENTQGLESEEFRPHHLHCRLGQTDAGSRPPSHQPPLSVPVDLRILHEFGSTVVTSANGEQGKDFAIGLFNTHFPSLKSAGYEGCLIQDFLYFLYGYLLNQGTPTTDLQDTVLSLAQQALRGQGRSAPPALKDSAIVRFLLQNKIRL